MSNKVDRISIICSRILYVFAAIFLSYGIFKMSSRESSLVYFILVLCFLIISSGKDYVSKRKHH